MTNNLKEFIVRWENRRFINEAIYKILLTTDIPRTYGKILPKIHKPNHPLQIIISSLNNPLYLLSTYLHNIIYNSFKKSVI